MSIQPPTKHAQEVAMLHNIINDYKIENERLQNLLNPTTSLETRMELGYYRNEYFKLLNLSRIHKNKMQDLIDSMKSEINDS